MYYPRTTEMLIREWNDHGIRVNGNLGMYDFLCRSVALFRLSWGKVQEYSPLKNHGRRENPDLEPVFWPRTAFVRRFRDRTVSEQGIAGTHQMQTRIFNVPQFNDLKGQFAVFFLCLIWVSHWRKVFVMRSGTAIQIQQWTLLDYLP
jgi:hypothetical protein